MSASDFPYRSVGPHSTEVCHTNTTYSIMYRGLRVDGTNPNVGGLVVDLYVFSGHLKVCAILHL